MRERRGAPGALFGSLRIAAHLGCALGAQSAPTRARRSQPRPRRTHRSLRHRRPASIDALGDHVVVAWEERGAGSWQIRAAELR